MKIYACGEAQRLNSPGNFLSDVQFGRVVGITDLGDNNSNNDFGWTGVKAVLCIQGENYVLDFPCEVKIETDDGMEFLSCGQGSPNCWHPSMVDRKEFGLYLFVNQG
jgi:hypothetical protein